MKPLNMKIDFFTNSLSTRNEGLTTYDIGFACVKRNHEIFSNYKLSYLGIHSSILPKKRLISSKFEDLYLFCNEELKFNDVIKTLFGYDGEDIFLIEKKLKNTLRSLLKKGLVLLKTIFQTMEIKGSFY